MTDPLYDDLMAKIRVLSETVWSGAQIRQAKVEAWLENFRGEVYSEEIEQLCALYLLSHFIFYGVPEFRELLRVVYRDLYLYPLVQQVQGGQRLGYAEVSSKVEKEVQATRFIGMGRPSESGSMLLYLFRQVNGIDVDKFLHSHQVFARYGSNSKLKIRDRSIRHYVFIDDLCGSGTQAIDYSQSIVSELKRSDPGVTASYFVVFSTDKGMQEVRRKTTFDIVECVFELDSSFKAFSKTSRHFASCPKTIRQSDVKKIFKHYGSRLWSRYPLGYKDGQLLLGFWHNTPDNTLPPVWFNEDPGFWRPIFERFHTI